MATNNQMFSSSPNTFSDDKCSTDSEQDVLGKADSCFTDTTQTTSLNNLTHGQSKEFLDRRTIVEAIILSSESEDKQDKREQYNLATDKNKDDEIVVLSSDDSLVISEEDIPHNISPIHSEGEQEKGTETKRKLFFDDMPKLDVSSTSQQMREIVMNNSIPFSSDDAIEVLGLEARPNESDLFDSIILNVSDVKNSKDESDNCDSDSEKVDILKLKSCHLKSNSQICLSSSEDPRNANSKTHSYEPKSLCNNNSGSLDETNLEVVESSVIFTPRGVGKFTPANKNRKTSVVQDVTTFENVVNSNESNNDISGVIDEEGEKILNDLYGTSWRTPQLLKICSSAKKRCFTEVRRRDRSQGFRSFFRDIRSELESTRSELPGRKENCDQYLDPHHSPLSHSIIQLKPAQEINGNHNDSSTIFRSNRKVPANRILDYSSDEDETDDVRVLSDELESDGSSEALPKTKITTRKKLIYLDLTLQEVVEEEDHHDPDASVEELEAISKNFVQSLECETYRSTPLPIKNTDLTPNPDDDPPLHKNLKPVQTPFNTKDTSKTPNRLTPKSSNGKKQLPTATPVTARRTLGFLASLDDDALLEFCDPYTLKYRNNFMKNRAELVKRLVKLFNDKIFGNKLSEVPVFWSKELRTTAGICCRHKKRNGRRICRVELSEKVCTTAERVRDTLIHELCHAASWIIDNDLRNHGTIWKNWTKKAIQCLPEIPKIEIYHHYEIDYKFTYKCSVCGLASQAHSKHKNVEKVRCTRCHGAIQVFINQKDNNGQVNLVPPKQISGFAKFVKEKYKSLKKPGVTHANVMQMLSDNFAKLTVEEKLINYKN